MINSQKIVKKLSLKMCNCSYWLESIFFWPVSGKAVACLPFSSSSWHKWSTVFFPTVADGGWRIEVTLKYESVSGQETLGSLNTPFKCIVQKKREKEGKKMVEK